MAGVIEDWRTNTATINYYDYPDDIDGSKDGSAGSRDGKLPSWAQWLRMFGHAGFPPMLPGGPNTSYSVTDYEWTEEDWKFVTQNLEKGTSTWTTAQDTAFNTRVGGLATYDNMTGYLAWWALGRANSTGDKPDMQSTIVSEITKNRKLPAYMADLFKKIKKTPEALSFKNVQESVDLVEFMLLMVGQIDDVLENTVITSNNGWAAFITKINTKVDEKLKAGINIKSWGYWEPSTGEYQNYKTESQGVWEWITNFGVQKWLFESTSSPFGVDEAEQLQNQMRGTLGSNFGSLANPEDIGKRIAGKGVNFISNTTPQSPQTMAEIYYNGKNVTIGKPLSEDNITGSAGEQVKTTLKEKLGKKDTSSFNYPISVSIGINNTNLYKWAQTETESRLFVPAFQGAVFNGPQAETQTQKDDFVGRFSFAQNEKELKDSIKGWYQAAWYGYVYWFINRKTNPDPAAQNMNQIQVADRIIKHVSEGIARIIAINFHEYEKALIWVEATALINSDDQQIDENELNAALANAKNSAEGAISAAFQGGGLVQEDPFSEEELKERQKFVKQCILMYNLGSLRNNYRSFIKSKNGSDSMHSKGPFNYRFHALRNSSPDDGANSLVTRLQMAPENLMKPLLDITPDIQAFLVPKIRLFRINSSNNGLKEIEFVFDKIEDKKRIDQLLSPGFDRGNSYGIKSFDFSFEGSNPATSRNDISANLSLYFQSFQDLIRVRDHGQGEYRIIDLLVFPINPKNKQGTKTIRAEEYDPSYYRIRADVGWAVPDKSPELTKVLQLRGFDYDGLKKAILATNKSFYLNAVDHEMDLRDDSSIEMKINYRAYAENALKTSKYDVLSSPTLRKNREKFKDAMAFAIRDNNCSDEELKTIKELFQKSEEELVKSTYRSIMKRLNDREKVFFVDVEPNDINSFRKNGFFAGSRPPKLLGVNGGGAVVQQGNVVEETTEKEAAKNTPAKEKQPTLKLLKDGAKDYSPENLQIDNRINFFYLGDLIYTAMDSLYEEDGSLRKDIEKTAFLLGSFDVADAMGSNDSKLFNIIDIPVSVEYFYEWFTQNVIKTKRLSYPMMDFIRDLTNNLVIKLLFDNCGKRPIDTKMRFNTASFLALGKGQNNDIDTFIDFSKSNVGSSEFPVIDVAKHYGTGLPFLTDKQGNANINDFYNYVLIYPVKSSSMYGGVGNFFTDGARGVHHFTIGRNKGLIKKIKFSKTDMNYIREARFFRNSYDGLQQLSAVYKASIEMYGNTMYYPGMELYIDAVGIGGPEFRSNRAGSLAHILGFGGYHLVTRVNINISPGKFSTTVEAQWFHSGAKGDNGLGPQKPRNKETKAPESSIEQKPSNSQNGDDEFVTACSSLISSLETYVESTLSNPTGNNEFNPDLSETTPGSTNSSGTVVNATPTGETPPSPSGNTTPSPETGE